MNIRTLRTIVQPAGVLFHIPKRLRLPTIPIDKDALQTGDCLVRVGWGSKTFHIPPKKYAALKSLKGMAKSVDELILQSSHSSLHEKQVVRDERRASEKRRERSVQKGKVDPLLVESDPFSAHQRTHRPDVISDREWRVPTSEPFIPSEWRVSPPVGMPQSPQPAPEPPKNSEDYKHFFIPDVRKKTAARTERGRKRFQEKMNRLWSERKALYAEGLRLLHDAEFFKHSESVDGPLDYDRHACPRCGCTVFDKTLRCHDCRYKYFRERTAPDMSIQEAIAHEEGNPPKREKTGKGRCRNQMTPKEFAAAILLSGKWLKLARNPKEFRSLKGSYLILCEGWLPRDVAPITGEKLDAIERRAERLWETLKHYPKNEPLPAMTIEHVQEMNSYLS